MAKRLPWQRKPGKPKGFNYSSRKWTNYSRWYRTKNPLCVECLEVGILTDCSPGLRTGVTDHKVPISEGGSIWDQDNHQTLCNDHHNKKRARERRGY